MAREHIEWAIADFREESRQSSYKTARDYYGGLAPIFFDDERFTSRFSRLLKRLQLNACAIVVDVLTERLELTGFAPGGEPITPDKRSRELWRRGRFDRLTNAVHKEAFMVGDGYAIVEPGPDGRAVVWHESADRIAVLYDDRTPGKIQLAAKRWRALDGAVRLNLYFEDRIEKYATKAPGRLIKKRPPKGLSAREFEPLRIELATGGARKDGVVEWDWGRVPVFHFPNRALDEYGTGELVDVFPIQDAINKLLVDAITTSEYGAFRQRYVTGMMPQFDESGNPKPPFNVGVDTMLVAEKPDASFGVMEASELGPFMESIDKFFRHVSRLTGIPLHYLYETSGDYPSGEALKSAEARFSKKLRDRQVAFGAVWDELFAFGLQIDGAGRRKPPPTSTWEAAVPQSEVELLEGLLLEKALGVPRRRLLIKRGYTPEQADQLLKEAADDPQPDDDGVITPVRGGRIRVDRRDFPAQ